MAIITFVMLEVPPDVCEDWDRDALEDARDDDLVFGAPTLGAGAV